MRLLGLTEPEDTPDSYQPERRRPAPSLVELEQTARALVTALIDDDTPTAHDLLVTTDESEFVVALAATQLAFLYRDACDNPCRCDPLTRWRHWIARDLAGT